MKSIKKNPVGKPRTVSPQPDDLIALGEEMIDWVKKHPEALHLSCWYCIHKSFTEKQWETMQDRPEFVPYYQKALKIIGHKYLDGTVNPSISQRWQRVYYKDLKKSEDQDMRDKIELEAKSKTDVPILTNVVELENELMLLRAENAKLKSANA